MAKGIFIGGMAQTATKMYIGVDGVARKVLRAYICDSDGQARCFWGGYLWRKYNVNTVNIYTDEISETKTGSVASNATITKLTNIVLDESTGIFTADETETTTKTLVVGDCYKYYTDETNITTYAKITKMTNLLVGFSITFELHTAALSPTEEQGSEYYGYVESADEKAYPQNGKHTDGYWYVATVYVWERFNVATGQKYVDTVISSETDSTATLYRVITSIVLDESTGVFSVETSIISSLNVGDRYVPNSYYSDGTTTRYKTVTAITSDSMTADVHEGVLTDIEVKGDTSYGTTTSSDLNTYPHNGKHTDGYWYVKL